MPVMTTSTRTMPATTPNVPSFRRETGGGCSMDMRHLRWGGGFGALLLVYHTKYDGDEHQRSNRRKYQTPDHGTAERRVLLATLAQPQRHRRHADDHGKRRHQHRTEADEAGFERCRDGVAEFLVTLARKADDQ